MLIPRSPSEILWAVFWAYWGIMALSAEKRTTIREPLGKRARELIFWAVALGLLVVPPGLLNPRIVPSLPGTTFGLAIQVLGMAVSVWARVHLGRYWSGSVTIKVGHELIESGPYHWVRHPIYTGLVLQMLGSSLTVGTLLALLTAPILYVGYRIKGSQEETLLRGQFGERYARYAERIPALLPRPWSRPKDQGDGV